MSDPTADPSATADAPNGELASRLLAPDTFADFVADCKALIAVEMKKKGMTFRTAFSVVQKVKPDIVDRTVRELMPEFVHALEPYYRDYRHEGGSDFRAYLLAHDSRVADAMLTVADRRADRIHSRAIHSAYNRVRGRARREVVDAMPDIAALIAKHADTGR